MNEIHPTARISPQADLETSVRGSRLVIGARSMVDSFVKIKFAGGSGDIIIGEGCYLNSGCVLYSGNGISIGDGVLIAANCTLAPATHAFADRDTPIASQGFSPSKGGIEIGDDVWIGVNCALLDGARVGKGAVIAAGSVIRGEVPEYAVFGGSPATFIKWRGV